MSSLTETVQQICLSFPETEVKISHGAPTYTARGKSFAIFSLNHHGDGKVALLLNASRETQQMFVESAPLIFFVPPYIGTYGWISLDLGLHQDWKEIEPLVIESYKHFALKRMLAALV